MADAPAAAARWRLLVTPLRSPGAPVTVSFGALQQDELEATPVWSKAGVHITHVAEGGAIDLEIRPTDVSK